MSFGYYRRGQTFRPSPTAADLFGTSLVSWFDASQLTPTGTEIPVFTLPTGETTAGEAINPVITEGFAGGSLENFNGKRSIGLSSTSAQSTGLTWEVSGVVGSNFTFATVIQPVGIALFYNIAKMEYTGGANDERVLHAYSSTGTFPNEDMTVRWIANAGVSSAPDMAVPNGVGDTRFLGGLLMVTRVDLTQGLTSEVRSLDGSGYSATTGAYSDLSRPLGEFGFSANPTIRIGSAEDFNGTGLWNTGEVLVMNEAISDRQLDLLASYAISKWGR